MNKFIHFYEKDFDDEFGNHFDKGRIFGLTDEDNYMDNCVEFDLTDEQLSIFYDYIYQDGNLVFKPKKQFLDDKEKQNEINIDNEYRISKIELLITPSAMSLEEPLNFINDEENSIYDSIKKNIDIRKQKRLFTETYKNSMVEKISVFLSNNKISKSEYDNLLEQLAL